MNENTKEIYDFICPIKNKACIMNECAWWETEIERCVVFSLVEEIRLAAKRIAIQIINK